MVGRRHSTLSSGQVAARHGLRLRTANLVARDSAGRRRTGAAVFPVAGPQMTPRRRLLSMTPQDR